MNTTKAQDCPRLLLRVLVADSDRPVNEGLTAMLSDLDGIVIFGCAQEAAKVVALVERVKPDVVILDLQVPHGIPVVVMPPRQVLPVPFGPSQEHPGGNMVRISLRKVQRLAHGLA